MKFTIVLMISAMIFTLTTMITACATTSDVCPGACSECRGERLGWPGCTGCEGCSRNMTDERYIDMDEIKANEVK